MRTVERTVSVRRAALAAAIAGVLALGAQRQAHADKICFNQFGHPALPGAPPNPPDGNLDDPHWTNSFLFDYHNGTPSPDATLKVGRDGNNLYLGWSANNITSFDRSDLIILAFKDSAGNLRRIDANPVCTSPGGIATLCNDNGTGVPVCDPGPGVATCSTANTKPWSVTYSTGTTPTCVGSNTCTLCPVGNECTNPGDGECVSGKCQGILWQETSKPALQFAVKATAGTPNLWSVELIMPAVVSGTAGYTINTTAWKLYSSAFRVDSSLGGVTELTWPDAPKNAMLINTKRTPVVADWGDASIAGGCTGVHVTKLRTNGTTDGGLSQSPLEINFDRTDMHVLADVTNNNANADASCVRARLRVANFGISNAWKDVPPPSANPTPPQGIGKLGSTTFDVGPWNVVTDPNHNDYIAHPHQCIRADLDVYTGPPTNCVASGSSTIDQASTFQNMDFGHSSVFTREPAEIRGDIVPPPPGKTANTYELAVDQKAQVSDVGVRATVAVRGLFRSGQFIELRTGRIVNDRPELINYEILPRLPAFGYVVDHPLSSAEVATWKSASPADLLKAWTVDLGLSDRFKLRSPGHYSLEIAPADIVKVTPRVEFVGKGGGGGGKPGGCAHCNCSAAGGFGATVPGLLFPAALVWAMAWRRRRRG